MAFAGNDHLVLAARSADRLAELDYDVDLLADLMVEQGWTTVCTVPPCGRAPSTTSATPSRSASIVEDPATGAAAAALAGYLRDLVLEAPDARLVLHQGHHIGTPSRLVVDLDPASRSVRVSGTATRLALSPYDELEPW